MKADLNKVKKMAKITQYYLIVAFIVVTVITLLNGVKGKSQYVDQPAQVNSSTLASILKRPTLNKYTGNRSKPLGIHTISVNGATMPKLPNGAIINLQKQSLYDDELDYAGAEEPPMDALIGRPLDYVKSEGTRPPPIKRNSNDYIQFPSEMPTGEPMRPMDCLGVTPDTKLCKEVVNYPRNAIDAIINRSNIRYQSNEDSISNEIVQRGGFETETRFCSTVEEVIHPQSGVNKQDHPLFIVNQDNFKQGIRIERCTHNNECAMAKNFPLGYRSQCRQRYMYRELYVFENNELKTDRVKIPSCCECVLLG